MVVMNNDTVLKPSEERWILYPLECRSVDELVMPYSIINSLRVKSRSYTELGGLLGGLVIENGLYVLGFSVLGKGTRTGVTFNDGYREFHNMFVKKTKNTFPSFTTVLYHTHPRVDTEELPQETIEYLKLLIALGELDHLELIYGERPNIRNATHYFTTQLSHEDRTETTGRCHVLVIDTQSEGTYHINAFKLDPDALEGELFRVTPLSKKPFEVQRRTGGLCRAVARIYDGPKM